MDPHRISRNHTFLAPIADLILGGLFIIGLTDYQLFHVLIEIVYILMATAIVIVTWNSLLLSEGSFTTMIGMSFPFIIVFLILHFLTANMPALIPGADFNRSTQLWIGARLLFGGTVLASALCVGRRVQTRIGGIVHLVVSAILLLTIWAWPVFPAMFSNPAGETIWLRAVEASLAVAFIAAAIIFNRKKADIEPKAYTILQVIIGTSLISEIVSAANLGQFLADDIIVHIAEVATAMMLYMLIVRNGLARPYSLLSNHLQQRGHELRRERDFASAVLDSAGALVVVLNGQGRIVRVNHACQEITGFSFDELRGRTVWQLGILAEDADQIQQAFEQQALAALPRTYEGELITRDKRRLRIAWTNALLMDAGQTVEYVISTGIDVTARTEAEDHLRYLSTHDALSGLYNRAYFETELDRLMRGRYFPVTVIMVDVDGLKIVNDSKGHTAGDELLLHVADILRSAFRAEDIIARIGGDEFCILLPRANEEVTKMVIDRVKENLELFNDVNPDSPIGLSMGSATAFTAGGLNASMIKADQVMYKVKSAKHETAAIENADDLAR
jgi:diguanylate cyclase (GGDEF)-like protein/PAS domain S-box-containing protein